VEVDISVPLKPGMFLPRNELDDVWIGLKYEKMPEFCYKCGLIGHEVNGCYSAATYISNQFDHKFPAFGPWLRSDNEDRPPGIYDKSVDLVAEPITPRVNTPVNLAVVPHPLPGVVGAHDHLAEDKGCRFTCQTSSGGVAVRPVPHDSVVPQLMPQEHNSLQVRNNILSRVEDSTEQVGFVSSSPQPDNSPVVSPAISDKLSSSYGLYGSVDLILNPTECPGPSSPKPNMSLPGLDINQSFPESNQRINVQSPSQISPNTNHTSTPIHISPKQIKPTKDFKHPTESTQNTSDLTIPKSHPQPPPTTSPLKRKSPCLGLSNPSDTSYTDSPVAEARYVDPETGSIVTKSGLSYYLQYKRTKQIHFDPHGFVRGSTDIERGEDSKIASISLSGCSESSSEEVGMSKPPPPSQ
jgi:cell division septation protein DedD